MTRTGSTQPRVVCYWNTSEGRKIKTHYERENKENQSNNAIRQSKRRKLNRSEIKKILIK